jgi:hypothetical protein
MSQDYGYPQALPSLHFGKDILALRSSMGDGQFGVRSRRKNLSVRAEFDIGLDSAYVRRKIFNRDIRDVMRRIMGVNVGSLK